MIYVECNTDYELMFYILNNRKLIGHSGGKSKVLRHTLAHDDFCVGLIDEDPDSHREPLMDKFNEIDEYELFKVYSNQNSPKFIIEIRNDLESWLRNLALKIDLNFNRSGLLNRSRSIRKTLNSSQKRDFRQFLDELSDKSPQFKQFVEIITSFEINKFNPASV